MSVNREHIGVMLCPSRTVGPVVQLDAISCMLPLAGEPGDRVQFSEFIKANVRLYNLRNGRKLSTKATANYLRGELATALRQVFLVAPALSAAYNLTASTMFK